MTDIAKRIQAALEIDPAINVEQDKIEVIEGDEICLEGTVTGIAAKRRALHVAREAAGTPRIMDHIRLSDGQRKNDDELREDADRMLRGDSDFQDIPVGRGQKPDNAGEDKWIVVMAQDGAIRLEGTVPSLGHRRLAEVLAWWVPGVADVDNRLHVQPPEEDNEGELRDALDLVLDKDQALDMQTINLLVRDGKVTLAGNVLSQEQRERAERNCWYVPGVHDVDNRLEIAAS